MIDTSANANQPKEFDTGLAPTESRIDLSALIADDNTAQQPKPDTEKQNIARIKSLMKPVFSSRNKLAFLAGQKRTYTNASELCYTHMARPFRTIEALSERIKQKRFKQYTPRESEFAQYEPEQMQKQLEIEIMEIRVKEKSYRENTQLVIPKHYRKVTRRTDEAGEFRRLERELQETARQYSRSFDEILQIFDQVNCDLKRLRDRLEGNTFCVWKKIEDLTLQKHFEDVKKNGGAQPRELDQHYKCLVEEKGLEEIAARSRYLGLAD